MTALFDDYRNSYGETVASAIRFSGLHHDFFLRAKADHLRRIVSERRLDNNGRSVRTLDLGCGIGSLHRHLEGAFSTLAGCDVSAEAISRARQNHPNVSYRVSASRQLPYEDHAFDLVFASCVLHHVPVNEWSGFLREMHRVLRPGGVGCVIEHNPWNPLTRLAVLRCPFDKDAVLLGAQKVEKLMREAGFTGIRSEHILLLPRAGHLAREFERALASVPLGAQYACSGEV
jgi:ubiquinone/menaquinone biosynthesis C-methylase UbiE